MALNDTMITHGHVTYVQCRRRRAASQRLAENVHHRRLPTVDTRKVNTGQKRRTGLRHSLHG